ncbi:MAG: hypothetical protein U1D30_21185 [Planctomycetota bacterium]
MGDLTASLFVEAIRTFLELAYPGGNVPENRRHFSALHGDESLESIWGLSGVEKLPPKAPGDPIGYSFRVGNAWYPHMKVTLQPYPSAPGFVFGVDTHDHFKLPANSPEVEGVRALQAKNLELARQVEEAWAARRIPTQRGLLEQYLEKARQGAGRREEKSP